MEIQLIGIPGIPLIKKGDNLAELVVAECEKYGKPLQDKDVVVIAETAVAKAEGSIFPLESLIPSEESIKLSKKTGKDPKLVEAIINESKEIIKVGPDFIISETSHGFVCANAGIDESNVSMGNYKPIPLNPDTSAKNIQKKIISLTQKEIAVIISDTQGRPFREGAIGVAIGISGMEPIWDRSGQKDLYGRKLQTTSIAVADELASAASIVMGQASEGLPVVIIRGVEYFEDLKNQESNIKKLLRPKEYDVFR
jgi:coenzyme F420-0:L-glutamate ligase/coenzyme F420-1:gamma-L-glutamate ligase